MRKLFIVLFLAAFAMAYQTSHAANIACMHIGTAPNAGDNLVINQLTSLGHTISLIPEAATEATITSTMSNCDMLIILSSIGSGSSRGKNMELIAKPILNCEQANTLTNSAPNLTTGNGPFCIGTGGNGTQSQNNLLIDATRAAHVLSANLSGSVTLFTAGATNIAINRVTADTGANAPVYALDLPPLGGGAGAVYQTNIAINAGGKLAGGGTAPAKRVLSFLTADNAPFVTAQGWRLFLAQVYWCLGQPLPALPPSFMPTTVAGLSVKNKAIYTSVTVSNPDANPVSINALKIIGPGSVFTIENPKTLPLTIAGLSTGAIVVKSLPTVDGTTTGTLQIGYNNSTSTMTVPLSVRAVVINNAWLHQDIGGPTLAGDATQAGNVFTVTASGSDIWNATSQFHYMYQYASGNNIIIAKVTASQNLGTAAQNGWVKSGVMFSEVIAGNSKFVDVVVSTSNGVTMQYRNATGIAAVGAGTVGGITIPVWVKLERLGDTFNGYYSTDGSTWLGIGSIVIPMNETLTGGLAVTSHDNAQLNRSTFDNVSLAPPVNAVNRWFHFE